MSDDLFYYNLIKINIALYYMSSSKKPAAPIGGTVVLIIFMAMALIMVTTFLDVGPFPSVKNNMRQMAQNIQVTFEQLIAGEPSAFSTVSASDPSIPQTSAGQIRTISNWEYTLKNYQWNGNTAVVYISIRNLGSATLPFGFSYEVSDEKFTGIYKLCAQNSSKQVFWDSSLNESGTGFYSQYFTSGEINAGTVQFKVSPGSEKVYLCLANGSNVANKLFYLGTPGQR